MCPPIMKTPDELRRLGMSNYVVQLAEKQYREWERAGHCCGMTGFEYPGVCPACERQRSNG